MRRKGRIKRARMRRKGRISTDEEKRKDQESTDEETPGKLRRKIRARTALLGAKRRFWALKASRRGRVAGSASSRRELLP
jgi:hypothetical protein